MTLRWSVSPMSAVGWTRESRMIYTFSESLCATLRRATVSARNKTESPLVFGHVCWGKLEEAATLRLTDVESREDRSHLAEFSGKGTAHTDAFGRHIRLFGRGGTLLDFLVRRAYNFHRPQAETSAEGGYVFLIRPPGGPKAPLIRAVSGKMELSVSFYDTLACEQDILAYVSALYSAPDTDDSTLLAAKEGLVGCRYATRRRVSSSEKVLASLRTVMEDFSAPEGESSAFIAALQTALMFVRTASSAGDAAGFVTVAVRPFLLSAEEGEKPEDQPVLLMSAVILESHRGEIENLKKELAIALKPLIPPLTTFATSARHLPAQGSLKQYFGSTSMSLRHELLSEAMTSVRIESKAFLNWPRELVTWLSLLIDKLRDQVHEGMPLTFSFVVGDRSEVMDSGAFDLLAFAGDGSALVPWDATGEVLPQQTPELIDGVVREITKNNYSWFQDGKYALFWDATFPSLRAQGLLRLKTSSWDLFIRHARMGRPDPATTSARVVLYSGVDRSSGLVVDRQEVLSYRAGHGWHVSRHEGEGNGRNAKVRMALSTALEPLFGRSEYREQLVDRMCSGLMAVSADPHAGCMLVVCANHERVGEFSDMGAPWATTGGGDPLKMSLDEMTSMMAMDGATCLWNNAPESCEAKVAFRRLVRLPAGAMNAELNSGHQKKYLDGEGSRKWSGGLAACRDDVAAVLSVSQDGPVFLFTKRQEEGTLRMIVDIDKA